MIKVKHKMTKLKNGLRVLLVPNKNVDSVQSLILFRVGSRCEDPTYSGISHFLEHMFFKGTINRPTAFDISQTVDGVGGAMNAFTGHEYTGYYIKVAKQHADLANDVLSDMILYSKFDQTELNRERGVIKEEIKMYEDEPSSYVHQVWGEVLYGQQGLGRDIAGTLETVDSIDSKVMVSYKDKFYSVANGLLVVVGNFTEKPMLEMLNKYWSKLPQGEKSIFTKTDTMQDGQRLMVKYRDIQQANFVLGVRAFGGFHPKYYIANLLNVILGQGMSSRLFINVRERNGLAYRIGSSMDSYTDAGAYAVTTGTDVGLAKKAIKLILKELKKMTTTKVGAQELKKAKEFWKGRLILSLEDAETMASLIGMQELMYHKVETPEQMLKKTEVVTATQVRDLAAEIFRPDKLNLAVVGPYKDDKEFAKLLKF